VLVNSVLTTDVMMPSGNHPHRIPWITIALYRGHIDIARDPSCLLDRPILCFASLPLQDYLDSDRVQNTLETETVSNGGAPPLKFRPRNDARHGVSTHSGDPSSQFLSLRTASMNCEFDTELSHESVFLTGQWSCAKETLTIHCIAVGNTTKISK